MRESESVCPPAVHGPATTIYLGITGASAWIGGFSPFLGVVVDFPPFVVRERLRDGRTPVAAVHCNVVLVSVLADEL